jgi:hypothetical protein
MATLLAPAGINRNISYLMVPSDQPGGMPIIIHQLPPTQEILLNSSVTAPFIVHEM